MAGSVKYGPAASLIVPTRGRADFLRLSLPRFLNQTLDPADYQVIVIDDDSPDDTARVLEDFKAANLICIHLEKQSGAAVARNRALSVAAGRVLVFVDDDSLVRPDFLARHLARHRDCAGKVVSGPIIEVSSPPHEPSPPCRPLLGLHFNPFPTGNVSVCSELVSAAGGFSPEFKSYGWEDAELYRRLAKLGARRVYEWRAPIYHFKPAETREDFFANCRREASRGASGALFYARHPEPAVGLQTKQLRAIKMLDRILDRLLGLEKRLEKARASGIAPASAFWKWLLLNHVEIAAGRGTEIEYETPGSLRRPKKDQD